MEHHRQVDTLKTVLVKHVCMTFKRKYVIWHTLSIYCLSTPQGVIEIVPRWISNWIRQGGPSIPFVYAIDHVSPMDWLMACDRMQTLSLLMNFQLRGICQASLQSLIQHFLAFCLSPGDPWIPHSHCLSTSCMKGLKARESHVNIKTKSAFEMPAVHWKLTGC